MTNPSSYRKLIAIAGTIIILDQVTKAVILMQAPLYQSLVVIPGFFNITHIQNPGGVFGFLSGSSLLLRRALFIVLTSMAACLVVYFYRKTPGTHPWLASGLALIFGGAVGNLIDRVRFGRVVDFLDFYVGNLHWPAFNVADSAVTIGVGIFVVLLVLRKIPY